MKKQSLALALAAIAGSLMLAGNVSADEPDSSIGLGLVSHGLGVSYTTKTDWSLRAGDQLQMRFVLGGISADNIDDSDINGIKYRDADISAHSFQGGVDWYPFSNRISNIFFSSGLLYGKFDYNAVAESNQNINIGGTAINTNDITSLNTRFDQSSVAPYLSMGWGNRLRGEKGFSFQAEVGVRYNLSDADVTMNLVDPGNLVSASALAAEKRELEDDLNGAQGFLSLGVSYQF